MRWHDLLFLHWPIDVAKLRPMIPATLDVDTFDGQAWIGIVPFRMSGIRHRCLPPIPRASAFPELNVRTYVVANNRPGVWFFSLDATNHFAVWLARRAYCLAYYHASIECTHDGDRFVYQSKRAHRGTADADFIGTYRPAGAPYHAPAGTIDYWLTARYCLYTADRRQQVWRGEIDHAPWLLQAADVDISVCTMTNPLGIELPRSEPLAHFALRVDAVAWTLNVLDDTHDG
jgi:hypothetical protein